MDRKFKPSSSTPSFWIRSAGDTGNIKIEMHQDANGDGVFTFGTDISSPVYADQYIKGGRVDKNWDKVVIPLSDFKDIKDWSKMSELVFVFENKAGNKQSQIDRVPFTFHFKASLIKFFILSAVIFPAVYTL